MTPTTTTTTTPPIIIIELPPLSGGGAVRAVIMGWRLERAAGLGAGAPKGAGGGGAGAPSGAGAAGGVIGGEAIPYCLHGRGIFLFVSLRCSLNASAFFLPRRFRMDGRPIVIVAIVCVVVVCALVTCGRLSRRDKDPLIEMWSKGPHTDYNRRATEEKCGQRAMMRMDRTSPGEAIACA